MKQFLFVLSMLITVSSLSQGYKAVSNVDELKQKLNASSIKTNSIISDFVQEKHMALLDEVITTKGKFWFKKENKLRWEYVNPYKYIIVINNGKFYIKDDEKTSEFDVNSNKAFKEINDLIISSVRGDLLKEDKFNIEILKNTSEYLVKLTPKNVKMKEILNQVELYFDITSLDITKVKMIENKDDFTIISFVNRKLNEEIPANTFIIK